MGMVGNTESSAVPNKLVREKQRTFVNKASKNRSSPHRNAFITSQFGWVVWFICRTDILKLPKINVVPFSASHKVRRLTRDVVISHYFLSPYATFCLHRSLRFRTKFFFISSTTICRVVPLSSTRIAQILQGTSWAVSPWHHPCAAERRGAPLGPSTLPICAKRINRVHVRLILSPDRNMLRRVPSVAIFC